MTDRSQLKIGFVLDDGLDSSDGVQQYVLTLGKWLTSQGHEVRYLVGQTSRKDVPGMYSLGKNIKVRFNQNALSIPLPVSKQNIRRILAKEEFDVLHVQMPFSPFLASRVIMAAPKTTAVVGTFHVFPASVTVSRGNTLLGYMVRRQLNRFNAVCAVSEPARVYMHKVFRLQGIVIPNGVDVAKFRSAKTHRATPKTIKQVVFLGRLVERKGAEHALQAFAAMKPGKDIRLEIAGTGPLLAKLTDLASELGIASQVTFSGYIDEADKATLLAGADVAVFPSTGGESFGIVLVEAMAAGAGVVLAGDNPGYRTVITNSQALVDPQNEADFANKLRSLLEDSKLRERLHAEQQQALKQFDIQQVGPQVVELYIAALRRAA